MATNYITHYFCDTLGKATVGPKYIIIAKMPECQHSSCIALAHNPNQHYPLSTHAKANPI